MPKMTKDKSGSPVIFEPYQEAYKKKFLYIRPLAIFGGP